MDRRIEPEVKADVPEVKEAKEDELKKSWAQWNAVEVLEFCSEMLQTCGISADPNKPPTSELIG